jgi:hypothetical protein
MTMTRVVSPTLNTRPLGTVEGRYVHRIGKFIFQIPGSPRRVRLKEVVEGASVKADEGWTERMKRGTTAAP